MSGVFWMLWIVMGSTSWYLFSWHFLWYFFSFLVISCHFFSFHFFSFLVISFHFISFHFLSFLLISFLFISCHFRETVTLPSGEHKVVKSGTFDFNKLKEVAKVATRNLNKVIDRNFYPCEEARRSNMRHRPIGIGIQGNGHTLLLSSEDRWWIDNLSAVHVYDLGFDRKLWSGGCMRRCQRTMSTRGPLVV